MVRNLMLLTLTAALWACGGSGIAWPPLPTAPRATSTPTNADQVRGLIDALQGLDLPDFGLSGTFSGERFSPAGVSEGGVMILRDHGLGQAAPMEELVRLGPSAIQALPIHAAPAPPPDPSAKAHSEVLRDLSGRAIVALSVGRCSVVQG